MAAACAVLWGASAALAQAPDPVTQEGLRRQEERSRDLQRQVTPRADALSPGRAQPARPEFPVETPCFQISEIALGGPDAVRFGWLVDGALPWLRRCVGVQGLASIAAQLDQALREQGYATSRVSLPPQNLQGGQLLIHVHAGRVADVRMVQGSAGTEPDTAWGSWRNAFQMLREQLMEWARSRALDA